MFKNGIFTKKFFNKHKKAILSGFFIGTLLITVPTVVLVNLNKDKFIDKNKEIYKIDFNNLNIKVNEKLEEFKNNNILKNNKVYFVSDKYKITSIGNFLSLYKVSNSYNLDEYLNRIKQILNETEYSKFLLSDLPDYIELWLNNDNFNNIEKLDEVLKVFWNPKYNMFSDYGGDIDLFSIFNSIRISVLLKQYNSETLYKKYDISKYFDTLQIDDEFISQKSLKDKITLYGILNLEKEVLIDNKKDQLKNIFIKDKDSKVQDFKNGDVDYYWFLNSKYFLEEKDYKNMISELKKITLITIIKTCYFYKLMKISEKTML
ncbi:hypothetical protein [Mycoplasmopsis columboralis]|uniref:Uncharacterized protein n=1 Tax=Mycoplasmopsis columboralis TaxID=171282 RepID=A0A449B5L8_9BACT|nr:hypothetical protein [Mycoplasmopsis columboralis]VEU75897.1 Uncharacterised protein [Mycoplasmopsis columboralis]